MTREIAVIEYKELYVRFITSRGVGSNDRVASSPKSYVSYLNGVSRLLNQDITAAMLRSEDDVSNVMRRLSGKRKEATLRHYQTAMRQYAAMVRSEGL